ncbi:MAG TPA: DUF1569 domain-containing protein [Tepidisphaeraceae bacterium]|jgi:hypothetical protein
MAERRTLQFSTAEDVATDVARLRHGYVGTGSWSLPQTCYHLNWVMQSSMKPGPAPADTPEQIARRPLLQQMLATGKIPNGLPAPDEAVPPADVPLSAVDTFLSTLEQFGRFAGPFAAHRLFGKISDDDRRRQQILHCAHHLSYLVPAEPSAT